MTNAVISQHVSQDKVSCFFEDKGLFQINCHPLCQCCRNALLQSGAKRYEQTDLYKASRNGYKPLALKTKHGELELLNLNSVNFPLRRKLLSGLDILQNSST